MNVKKLLSLFFTTAILLGSSFCAFAQDETGVQDAAAEFFNNDNQTSNDPFNSVMSTLDSANVFAANFGLTRVGDQTLLGFRVQPELAFGKFGVGLDVPLLYNLTTNEFRTEEFENGVGILRMIRYLRYGKKRRDKVYIRLGDISGSYVGYGILVNNYSNATSFERRKVGVNWDFQLGKHFGIEGIYSDMNFDSFNLLAVRPYVKPFSTTSIPIIKTTEIGFTYLSDKDKTSQPGLIEGTSYGTSGNDFIRDGMSSYSADLGVTLLKVPFIKVMASFQYAKILKNDSQALQDTLAIINDPFMSAYTDGDGWSVGINAKIRFIANIFTMDARIERLSYSDYFQPMFFDAVYEINKDAKLLSLANTTKKQGIYGSLTANVINIFRLTGSLMIPDNVDETNPATIRLDLASDLGDKIILNGSYIKGQLTDLGDAFTFDERSIAKIRAAYRINKFFVTGMDYYWTFAKQEDGSFDAVNWANPYFGINIPLNKKASDSNTSTRR